MLVCVLLCVLYCCACVGRLGVPFATTWLNWCTGRRRAQLLGCLPCIARTLTGAIGSFSLLLLERITGTLRTLLPVLWTVLGLDYILCILLRRVSWLRRYVATAKCLFWSCGPVTAEERDRPPSEPNERKMLPCFLEPEEREHDAEW